MAQSPPAVDPFTVVSCDPVTRTQIEDRVKKTRAEHGDLLQQYHEVYYNSGHTWCFTQFLNMGVMKSPNDLWAYQELITRYRPKTIIETGTCAGGSSVWFAFIMDALGIDGRVWTIDYKDQRQGTHPRVAFIRGDSTSPVLAEDIIRQIEYPLLVSLDADHSEAHVRKELELYAPAVQVGDWIVVEDTNISWEYAGERGARAAVEEYLRAHPGEFRQDVLSERWLYTANPGGWLQRVADHVSDAR